jgi:hypothetical protein
MFTSRENSRKVERIRGSPAEDHNIFFMKRVEDWLLVEERGSR